MYVRLNASGQVQTGPQHHASKVAQKSVMSSSLPLMAYPYSGLCCLRLLDVYFAHACPVSCKWQERQQECSCTKNFHEKPNRLSREKRDRLMVRLSRCIMNIEATRLRWQNHSTGLSQFQGFPDNNHRHSGQSC